MSEAPAIELTKHGPGRLWAFAPARLGLAVKVIPGTAPAQGYPIAPADAMTVIPGSLAAFPGPEFDFAPHDGHDGHDGDQGYKTSHAYLLQARYLDRAQGVDVAGTTPGRGVTIAVVNGAAVAADHNATPQGASVAVQLFPTMVRNGRGVDVASTGANASVESRACLGILPDGRLGVLAGSYSLPGIRDAARALFKDCGYLDGGGSWEGFSPSTPPGHWGGSKHRRLASWIIVRGMGAATGGGGAGALVLLVVLLLANRR